MAASGAIWFSMPIAMALAAGGLLEALAAVHAAYGRRQLVARLALLPAAYRLPEVAAYGSAAAQPSHVTCNGDTRPRTDFWITTAVA